MAEEYVKGRLPQESNPTPGRYPGFVASHDTTGNEDYRPTSPDNPLPTSNYIQRESGVWVPISKDNPMPTQLTGSKDEYELPVRIDSNVEIINVFKGVEIPPGGTARLDPPIDIHKFSDILIQFRSGGIANGFASYQIDSLWHQGDKGGAAFAQNIIDETNRTSNVSSEWTSVMGVKTTISVKNRMEEEKTFNDLTVMGRRL